MVLAEMRWASIVPARYALTVAMLAQGTSCRRAPAGLFCTSALKCHPALLGSKRIFRLRDTAQKQPHIFTDFQGFGLPGHMFAKTHVKLFFSDFKNYEIEGVHQKGEKTGQEQPHISLILVDLGCQGELWTFARTQVKQVFFF